MKFVKIHPEFGIVIRKDALVVKGVQLEAVLAIFRAREAFDENEALVSFGPHFGQEAAKAMVDSLERLGLAYVDDFFMFATEGPDWCQFGAAYVEQA